MSIAGTRRAPAGSAAFPGFKHNVGAWALLALHEEMERLLELQKYRLEMITPPTSHCVFGPPGSAPFIWARNG